MWPFRNPADLPSGQLGRRRRRAPVQWAVAL